MNNELNNFNQNTNNSNQFNGNEQPYNTAGQQVQASDIQNTQANNIKNTAGPVSQSQVNYIQQNAGSSVSQTQTYSVTNEPKKINKNAIISLFFGLFSLFMFWFVAFAGIGVGIKAIREIRGSGEKGKVLALIGIIISFISIVLSLSKMVPR